MDRETVGIIGLGLMGSAIAKRLVAQGYKVVGSDVDDAQARQAEAAGLRRTAGPAETAETAGLVLLALPTTEAVIDVVIGEHGLCQADPVRARAIVDLSTTEIDATQEVSEHVMARLGIAWVDAPMSGGPPAAESGTLAIMAGGTRGAVVSAEPILRDLGKVTHMGASGTGQATKLVNQILVLNNFVVMAEALRMAQAYGVDAAKVPEALGDGYAGSNLLPVMFERMIARDWTPTGYARQVLKDLELVSGAAEAKGLSQPMTSQATTLFRMLVGSGRGDIDGAAVLELLPQAKTKPPSTSCREGS